MTNTVSIKNDSSGHHRPFFELIRQYFVLTYPRARPWNTKFKPLSYLCDLCVQNKIQVVVFCDEFRVASLAKQMNEQFTVSTIHNDMNLVKRKCVLYEFRQGAACILIVSNLLDNNIHLPPTSLIINYDLPSNCEKYGDRVNSFQYTTDTVISFIPPSELRALYEIEVFYCNKIDEMPYNSDDWESLVSSTLMRSKLNHINFI